MGNLVNYDTSKRGRAIRNSLIKFIDKREGLQHTVKRGKKLHVLNDLNYINRKKRLETICRDVKRDRPDLMRTFFIVLVSVVILQ